MTSGGGGLARARALRGAGRLAAAVGLVVLLLIPTAWAGAAPATGSVGVLRAPHAVPLPTRPGGPVVAPEGSSPGAGQPARPTSAPLALPITADAWTNVSVGQRFSPPGLVGASVAYDPLDNYLVLFGGCSAVACPVPAQTWRFAGGNWSQIAVGSTEPPARDFASMTYDSKDGYVLLVGGWGAGGAPLNDTWAFVGGVWTNLTQPGTTPPAGGGAGMTFDPADGYVVRFGGAGNASTPTAQTWGFVAGSWRNLSAFAGAPPTARTGAGLAWDDTDSYALLFGGMDARGRLLGDSWSFVHGRWTAVNLTSTTAPSARTGAALSFSGQDNAVLLFGGNGSTGPLGDTWRYSGGRWVNMTATYAPAPGPRAYGAALDSSLAWTSTGQKQKNGFLLLWGGGAPSCLPCATPGRNETWVFEPVLQATASALPSVVEVGQPTVFSATVSGGSPPYLLSWRFGDGTSAILPSPSHAFATLGAFNVTVTASDLAGVSDTAVVAVSVVRGPSVSIALSSPSTDVDRTVWLNASVNGGTPPYVVRWSLGDATSAMGGSAAHAYGLPGTYTGNATATDAVGGQGIAGFSLHVNPVLSFVASVPTANVNPGTNASFGVVVSGGTAPYRVNWTFGDGAGSDRSDASHSYGTGGTYSVRVTVWDAVGAEAMQNFTVQVTNATATGDWLGIPVAVWAVILVVGLGAVAGALYYRRRRRRRPPTDSPIAAIAAGEGAWGGTPESDRRPDSRSARRNAQRWGRR